MKLFDRFMKAPIDTPTWKIYHADTRKKLSDDYGAEIGDTPHDDMSVIRIIGKTDKHGKPYYRVSVR